MTNDVVIETSRTSAEGSAVRAEVSHQALVEGKSPVLAAVLAFFCFGLGHFYLGRRWKAAVFFGFLAMLFLSGIALESDLYLPTLPKGTSVTWLYGTLFGVFKVLYQCAYLFSGAFYAVGRVLDPFSAISSVTYEIGWNLTLIASLLNVLVVVDAWDIASRKKG